MVKNKKPFTFEEFIETQVQVSEVFENKLNQIFIKNIASKENNTRAVLFEVIGLMRQTLSWSNRINKAMIRQNKFNIPKQKKSQN